MVGTANRAGQDLVKRFRVHSNDKTHSRVTLVVEGKILGYIEVTPDRVRLTGRVGEELRQQVRLVPRKGYPFTIKTAKPHNGKDIKVDLKPLGNRPSRDGYLLTVTCTRKEPGSFGDYIEVRTDLKEKPLVGIPVSGHLYGQPVSKRQDKPK